MSLSREVFLELNNEFTINDQAGEYGITEFMVVRDPATQDPRAFAYSYAYLNGEDDISFHVLELPVTNEDVAAIRKETLSSARLKVIKEKLFEPLAQAGIGSLGAEARHRVPEQERDIFSRTVASALDVAQPEGRESAAAEPGVSKATFNKDGSFSVSFKPR